MPNNKTVTAAECTNNAMVSGNEKHISIIIKDNIVKEWVGIGWIELRDATEADKQKYPILLWKSRSIQNANTKNNQITQSSLGAQFSLLHRQNIVRRQPTQNICNTRKHTKHMVNSTQTPRQRPRKTNHNKLSRYPCWRKKPRHTQSLATHNTTMDQTRLLLHQCWVRTHLILTRLPA